MRKLLMVAGALVMLAGLTHCAGEDPDVRRGDLFYKNGKYYEAFQAYEKAVARDAKLLDTVKELREHFKDAYYYYGGQQEMNDALDSAVKYYEKGLDLVPNDPGMTDKLAKYYWKQENFEKAGKFFGHLVELDSEAPDTPKKWMILGEDYYALGYSLSQTKKYPEAVEALNQSLKASPKGKFAAKAKSAIEAAKFAMKKK